MDLTATRARACLLAVGLTGCTASGGVRFVGGAATVGSNLGPDGQVTQMIRQGFSEGGTFVTTLTTWDREGRFLGSLGYGGFGTDPPPFADDGMLGVVAEGNLLLMNAWLQPWATWATGGTAGAAPAVDVDGTWLIPAGSALVALGDDGALAWTVDVGGTIAVQPAIGVDGSVAVSATDATPAVSAHLVDADGSVRWSTPLAGDLQAWIARSGDRVVVAYAAAGVGKVSSLHADDGEVLWTTEVEGLVAGLAIAGDDDVVVGTLGEPLYRLDADDGAVVAETTVAPFAGQPSLDARGRTWVACTVGVCAFDEKLRPLSGLEGDNSNEDASSTSVAIDDGTVVAILGRTVTVYDVPGIAAPATGWSRPGGGPRGAGREAGR